MRSALRAVLLLFVGGWLVLVAGVGMASAHAAVESTDPPQGTVLAAAPQRVSLTFSETVQVAEDGIRVFGPGGGQVDDGHATHFGSGAVAGVALRNATAQGTYTVSWRVVSADSHPVSGAFTFSVGHASPAGGHGSAAPPSGSTTVGVLYAIVRALAFASFAVLVGAVTFLLVCLPSAGPSRVPRLVVFAGWAVSVVSCLFCLVLQGPYGFGLKLSNAFDSEVVQEVLASPLGGALQARLLVLFLAGLYLTWLTSGPLTVARRWQLGGTGAVLAVALAVTWAVSGHAAVGLQPAVALPVDVVHLLSMGVWLGGLTALVVVLARRSAPEAELHAAARRFSPIAAGAVIALVGTGSYQAWRQLGTWSAWLSTGYGRLLFVKVGVVVVLFGAAGFSRRLVRRRGAAGSRALRRSVLVEACLGVVVLSVTALLVESEPGRTATAAPPGPQHREVAYDTGGPDGQGKVELDVDPAAGGPNTVRVSIEDNAGRPHEVPEFHLALTLPARKLGPLEIPLRHTGPGGYEAIGAQIPVSGSWQFALTVRTSEIDETTVATRIDIR